jgi:hypothetical protein
MARASYKIVPKGEGWAVDHDGKIEGRYSTKEAAFEAAVLPASNAIKEGLGVQITVEGRGSQEPNLGAR